MTCQLSRTNLRLFLVVIEFSCSYRLLKESPIIAISMFRRWIKRNKAPVMKKKLRYAFYE